MPRDGNGNYTLPGGINPVITGTTIDVSWANPTMDDIATALTDSLSRTGSGGMLVPFLNADGAIGSPGISWVNETTMGFYRSGAGEMRVPITGVDRSRWVDALDPVQVWIVSDASWRPLLNTFNPYTIIGDWTHQGDVIMDGASLVTDDSTLTRAGFNIPTGVEPTAPNQGDMWVEAGNIFAWINGVAESLIGSTLVQAGNAFGDTLRWDGSGWEPSDSLEYSTSPERVEVNTVMRFHGNAQFQTASNNDYMWLSGFNNIYSIVGVGIVDQLTFSGWDFLELDGPTLKIFELGAPTAGDEAQYGQFWVRNDNPPIFVYRNDVGTDFPFCERGSFTLDWSVGFSDSNDNDYEYVRIGDFVHIWQVGSNLGNSNGTACGTSDGIPVSLRPASLRYVQGSIVDNASAIVLSLMIIQTDGSIDAFAPDASNPPDYGNDWTNSGVKGPNAGMCFSYHITD